MTPKRITAQRGEDCIISKLNNSKVKLIRENAIKRDSLKTDLKGYPAKTRKTDEYLRKRNVLRIMSNKAMANEFKVSEKAIEAVIAYKTWAHI